MPTPEKPTIQAYLEDGRTMQTVFFDPVTSQMLENRSRFLQILAFVQSLHIYLLAGPSGLIANGIGAVCLLLLCVTGVLIWWPGLKKWKRALTVDFARKWKRINFDLHRAIGFWTLGIVSFWAISGIYFSWPQQVVSLVNQVSQVTAVTPPAFRVSGKGMGAMDDVSGLIRTAEAASPGTRFAGVGFPAGPSAPAILYMGRGEAGDFLRMDYLYLDPFNGKHLATWHYGRNRTLGDWVVWLMHPLHFGTEWGLAVKCLWTVLGLSLPMLTLTGILMYWNRVLQKKWHRLRHPQVHSLVQSA